MDISVLQNSSNFTINQTVVLGMNHLQISEKEVMDHDSFNLTSLLDDDFEDLHLKSTFHTGKTHERAQHQTQREVEEIASAIDNQATQKGLDKMSWSEIWRENN